MGQAEVMQVLENHDKPLSVSQIAEEVGDLPYRVNKTLSKLLKHNEVKCIEYDRFKSAKLLNKRLHRRMRFYYV